MERDAGAGTAATRRVRLAVDGMHCDSCVALIEEVLGEQAGVVAVEVDLASGAATVDLSPTGPDPDRLCDLVRELGYAAAPVT